MKLIINASLSIFLAVTTLHAEADYDVDGALPEKPQRVDKTVQKAFNTIKPELVKYKQWSEVHNPRDLKNLREYLHYYRSAFHYQAVTPPPRDLLKELSPAALKVIGLIESTAEEYFLRPTELPGQSKLTPEGDEFYYQVRNVFSEIIRKPQIFY